MISASLFGATAPAGSFSFSTTAATAAAAAAAPSTSSVPAAAASVPMSGGLFGFGTTTGPPASTTAVAPQLSAGFTPAVGQTSTFGLPFGAQSLGTQPQNTTAQTGATLPPAFNLSAAAASTGQSGGFQFAAGAQLAPASSAGGINLGAGGTTTTASGFTFSAVPAASAGPAGLMVPANMGPAGLMGPANIGPAGLMGPANMGPANTGSLFAKPGLSLSMSLCTIVPCYLC